MFSKQFVTQLLLFTLTWMNAYSQDLERSLWGWGACPLEGLDAKKDLDFGSFISARWYSIKQKEVFYQPVEEFYCVYAEYAVDMSTFCLLCFDAPRITVFNRSQRDSVSGAVNSVDFRAVVPRSDEPGKAFVGPNFIPQSFATLFGSTNYWVIDAGTDSAILKGEDSTGTDYDWAIITAGAPDQVGANGKCFAGGGQWIFHRDPEPSSNVVSKIEERADSLGLDVTQWLPVQQSGCSY